MTERALTIIVGLLIGGIGVEIVCFGDQYIRGFPLQNWIGLPFIVFGAFFIIFGLVSKPERLGDKDVYRICPKCMHMDQPYNKASDLCPRCGQTMEPLDGFYDRHPELEDAPGNDSSNSEAEKIG